MYILEPVENWIFQFHILRSSPTKGQLISKCLQLFQKKRTKKKSSLLLWYLKSNSFCLFFERIEDIKKKFRNSLTFNELPLKRGLNPRPLCLFSDLDGKHDYEELCKFKSSIHQKVSYFFHWFTIILWNNLESFKKLKKIQSHFFFMKSEAWTWMWTLKVKCWQKSSAYRQGLDLSILI